MKASVFLPDEMYERVREECTKRNMKVSQFIQMCIEHEFNVINAESAITDMTGVGTEEIYTALQALPALNENLKALTNIQRKAENNNKKS